MQKSDADNSSSLSGQFGRLLFSPPGIAFLVAITSLVLGSFGFRLARLSSEAQAQSGAAELLRFDSRIWQDPEQLLTADKLRELKGLPLENAVDGNWKKFRRDFFSRITATQTNAILFVINNHSPFPQGVELRLRNRVAVLAALRAAGLVKKSADETRFVQLAEAGKPAATDNGGPPDLRLIPAEVFTRDKSIPQPDHPYENVLVFWLPERDIRWHPWHKLKFLADKILENGGGTNPAVHLQLGVLGPRSSDGLAALFGREEFEYLKDHPITGPVAEMFDRLQIVSPFARAPDAFYDFVTNAPEAIWPRAGAEAKLKTVFTNCSFRQFGSTDDRLCFALAAELALRGVNVTSDKILLLSEYDTFYGRSLPMTFRAVAATLKNNHQFPLHDRNPEQLMQHLFLAQSNYSTYREYDELSAGFRTNLFRTQAANMVTVTNIFSFAYLAGLDGSKTAADNPKEGRDNAAGDSVVDQPLGDQQLDYTKRLAYSLNQKIASAVDSLAAGDKVKAIGLLGSDVFDKLLMLQALHARLPECVFFTTELDARYTMPSQSAWTRNLITASGFDLVPPAQSEQLGFAPFRDGYQTGAYLACLNFLNGLPDTQTEDLATYEIGRTVPHRLKAVGKNDSFFAATVGQITLSSFERAHKTLKNALSSPALMFGFLVFVFLSLAASTVFRANPAAGFHWIRNLLIGGGLLLGGWLLVHGIYSDGLEPMETSDGVSTLPSLLLLLMSVVLSAYGLKRCGDADKQWPVSANTAFVICIISILVLEILVNLFSPTPMRSPNEWRLRTAMVVAWSLSGILCMATAFFWRAFLGKLQTLLAQAHALKNQPQAGDFVTCVNEAFKLSLDVESFGRLSHFPMATILMLSLAGSTWLDAWHLTAEMWLLLGFQVLIIVVLPLLVQAKAKHFKQMLVRILDEARLDALQPPSAEAADGANAETGGNATFDKAAQEKCDASLGSLNRGCFAPLTQQPVIGALASLIGGSGLVSLLQQFLAG